MRVISTTRLATCPLLAQGYEEAFSLVQARTRILLGPHAEAPPDMTLLCCTHSWSGSGSRPPLTRIPRFALLSTALSAGREAGLSAQVHACQTESELASAFVSWSLAMEEAVDSALRVQHARTPASTRVKAWPRPIGDGVGSAEPSLGQSHAQQPRLDKEISNPPLSSLLFWGACAPAKQGEYNPSCAISKQQKNGGCCYTRRSRPAWAWSGNAFFKPKAARPASPSGS